MNNINGFWIYLITYDLRTPGRNYGKLFEGIKANANTWAHPLESVWLILSTMSQKAIIDDLSLYVDRNDILLVVELKPSEWASYNLDPILVDWLKKHAA